MLQPAKVRISRELQLIFFRLIFLQFDLRVNWTYGQLNFSVIDLSTHDLWPNWPLWPLAFLQIIFLPFDLIYIWTHFQLIFPQSIFFQLIFLIIDLFAHWSLCQLIFLHLIFWTTDLQLKWLVLHSRKVETRHMASTHECVGDLTIYFSKPQTCIWPLLIMSCVLANMRPASATSEAVRWHTLFPVSKNYRTTHFLRPWLKSKAANRPRFLGTGWPQIRFPRLSEVGIQKIAFLREVSASGASCGECRRAKRDYRRTPEASQVVASKCLKQPQQTLARSLLLM